MEKKHNRSSICFTFHSFALQTHICLSRFKLCLVYFLKAILFSGVSYIICAFVFVILTLHLVYFVGPVKHVRCGSLLLRRFILRLEFQQLRFIRYSFGCAMLLVCGWFVGPFCATICWLQPAFVRIIVGTCSIDWIRDSLCFALVQLKTFSIRYNLNRELRDQHIILYASAFGWPMMRLRANW